MRSPGRHPRTTVLLLVAALCASLLPATAGTHDDEISTADVAYACRQDTHAWNPASPPGPVHVAGLVEAPNGDLLYTFDGDVRRGTDNHGRDWPITRTYLSRLPVGGHEWSFPQEIIYNDPDATHNTVLYNNDAGRIHNFFTTRRGPNHSNSTLDYRYSDDSGSTWSDPEVMREEHGWMFGNRPFRMSNGEDLVPVYKEGGAWGVGVMISGDDFETWEIHPNPLAPWPGAGVGGLQNAVVELSQPGHLLAYMRTNARYIFETRSFDYGRTWTPAVPTSFPNPWSRIDLIRLDSGNLVLAYNPVSSGARVPLRLSLSEDEGRTWPHTVLVETETEDTSWPLRFDYPYLLQSSDGMIHLGYTHRAATMRHVALNEEFIRQGVDMPSHRDFSRFEMVGEALEQVDACGYTPDPLTVTATAYACRQDVHPHDRDYPGEYVHVASLTEAPNGDLLFGFVGGTTEHSEDKGTHMARLHAGESDWEPPREIFNETGKADGNAVLWHDGQGKLYLFFSTITGSGWSQAILRYMTSADNGHTWSEPRIMRETWGWNVGTLPLRMSNGETILPIYDERFGSSGFYISGDEWDSWKSHPGVPAAPENEQVTSLTAATWPRGIQAATVELDPGHLLAYMRTGLDRIYQTESLDYGRTWTPATPTDLPNPGARVALIKLANGNLLLASNPVDGDAPERSPMRLALSEDGGQTWPHQVDVETNEEERFQYPYLFQSSDGAIHLGYTHMRRTKNMRHVVFNEDFVRAGVDLESNPATGRRPYEGEPVYSATVELTGDDVTEVDSCAYRIGGGIHSAQGDSA